MDTTHGIDNLPNDILTVISKRFGCNQSNIIPVLNRFNIPNFMVSVKTREKSQKVILER